MLRAGSGIVPPQMWRDRRLINARTRATPHQARPTFESVGEWKYWLSSENSFDQAAQFVDAALGGADRQALLAARITAGLTRVQPVLDGAGEQAIGDVPEVGLVVVVGDLVAEIDGLAEGLVERMGFLLMAVSVGACRAVTKGRR